jgi:hypothetical protein
MTDDTIIKQRIASKSVRAKVAEVNDVKRRPMHAE